MSKYQPARRGRSKENDLPWDDHDDNWADEDVDERYRGGFDRVEEPEPYDHYDTVEDYILSDPADAPGDVRDAASDHNPLHALKISVRDQFFENIERYRRHVGGRPSPNPKSRFTDLENRYLKALYTVIGEPSEPFTREREESISEVAREIRQNPRTRAEDEPLPWRGHDFADYRKLMDYFWLLFGAFSEDVMDKKPRTNRYRISPAGRIRSDTGNDFETMVDHVQLEKRKDT